MGQRSRSMLLASALFFVLASGCAAPERPVKAPPHSPGLGAAIDDWEGAAPAYAAPTSKHLAPIAAAPVSIVAPPDAPPRPQRTRKVAVHFQRADLPNALQFLADAGRFNLVLESGLSGQVTASLEGVDPYDALVTLAEANGATVAYDRRIVVVKRR